MIKMTQDLKLSQRLEQKLTLRQIQQATLIQLQKTDLITELKAEIEDNPILDFEENFSSYENEDQLANLKNENYENRLKDSIELKNSEKDENFDPIEEKFDFSDVDWDNFYENNFDSDSHIKTLSSDKDDFSFEKFSYKSENLHEYLKKQLLMSDYINNKQNTIATNIIGNIDPDGYFKIYNENGEEIEDPVLDLALKLKYSKEDIYDALYLVQSFEPAGIAARNLEESLYLQLEKNTVPISLEDYHLLSDIILNFLEFIYKNRFSIIEEKLKISKKKILELLSFIKTNFFPKPGLLYSSEDEINYITPDVFVERLDNNKFLVSVNNDGIPNFKFNKKYLEILKNKNKDVDKKTYNFVKDKFERANILKEALLFRENTLKIVTETIINYQLDFFITMDKKFIKPMILDDIATETNLNVATVSRATNSKYMELDGELFELKQFFSAKLKTGYGNIDSSSAIAVKEYIKEIIKNENKQKPFSDDAISKILLEKYSIKAARRTVAKYRESLNIPTYNLRKIKN